MLTRTPTKSHRCPVAAFQKMISGKYKLRILWDLQDGPLRYGEIRSGLLRGVEGHAEIAPRVLSRELKALAQSGLIDRKDFGVVPPKVEYRLTRARTQLHPGHSRDPVMGQPASERPQWSGCGNGGSAVSGVPRTAAHHQRGEMGPEPREAPYPRASRSSS